jgi:hypothetical protein
MVEKYVCDFAAIGLGQRLTLAMAIKDGDVNTVLVDITQPRGVGWGDMCDV